MMNFQLGRRRILITGAASGLALLAGDGAAAKGTSWCWRGMALGADSTILLSHPDREAAERAITACRAEIARLERIFSLYRADSALSLLNRLGHLDAPPLELVELLGLSARVSAATGGAFDATVQPLWDLYAGHFADPDADPAGPGEAALAATLEKVGWRAVELDTGWIGFRRAGMAVTLNGVAQGYITDRIADLLRDRGFADVLVELGEIRALGRRPDGHPWRAGITDPLAPSAILRRVALADAALASSAASGTWLDPGHRHHHLLDPATGRSAMHHAGVSVQAGRAAMADALATALSILPAAAAPPVLAALGPAMAYVVAPDGRQTTIAA
jgi:thiamine biosynthesis lipoprotein